MKYKKNNYRVFNSRNDKITVFRDVIINENHIYKSKIEKIIEFS